VRSIKISRKRFTEENAKIENRGRVDQDPLRGDHTTTRGNGKRVPRGKEFLAQCMVSEVIVEGGIHDPLTECNWHGSWGVPR